MAVEGCQFSPYELRKCQSKYNVEGCPVSSGKVIMFERYTEKARRVIFFGRYEASQFGSPYIETEHLLLGLLREDKALSHRLLPGKSQAWIRGQIEARTVKGEKVSTSVDLPLSNECKRVLAYAAEEAERLGHKHIGTEHLLLGLLREEKSFAAELLRESGVQLSAAREEIVRLNRRSDKEQAAQGTPSRLSINLGQQAAEGRLRPFVGREKEMEELVLALGRSTKNNAALVGEPGVGRRSLVEGLAQRMAQGNVPSFLTEKALVQLDIAGLARGSPEQFLEQLARSLPEEQKVILFVEDFLSLLATDPAAGAVNVSEALKPLLLDGRMQCISNATLQEWNRALERCSWLDRCFRRVDIEPMNPAVAMEVLSSAKERYERFHSVVYTDDALQHAVLYSTIYVKDRHLPDKALDLLDEAAAYVNAQTRLPEEILELRKKIRFIIERMQNSIANHEFEKARLYSDEERKERTQLEILLKKHHLSEGSAIEVTRAHVEEVLARWTGIPASQIRESGTGTASAAKQ